MWSFCCAGVPALSLVLPWCRPRRHESRGDYVCLVSQGPGKRKGAVQNEEGQKVPGSYTAGCLCGKNSWLLQCQIFYYEQSYIGYWSILGKCSNLLQFPFSSVDTGANLDGSPGVFLLRLIRKGWDYDEVINHGDILSLRCSCCNKNIFSAKCSAARWR